MSTTENDNVIELTKRDQVFLEAISGKGSAGEYDFWKYLSDEYSEFDWPVYMDRTHFIKRLVEAGVLDYYNPNRAQAIKGYSVAGTRFRITDIGALFITPACPIPLDRTPEGAE